MKNSRSESYAAAGVDITAGYKAVELMKKHVARTRNEGSLDDVGGFGGCYDLGCASGMEHPILVSGTDGCGTKVKLAILMDKHDTIGIDAVAMCVNDIICVGAKPLYFLDYIACGKNVPEKIAEIVSGGIIGIAREIGEDAMDVHYVLSAVDFGERRVVGARVGDLERLEGVKIAAALGSHRTHGCVVDGVHRLDRDELFGKVNVEIHFYHLSNL